ncbi:hypothetical protein [Spirochaeta lutea]|nr:hypothetical protein [Spirochaeta lutea]
MKRALSITALGLILALAFLSCEAPEGEFGRPEDPNTMNQEY